MASEANTLEVAGSQIAQKLARRPMILWAVVGGLVAVSVAVYFFTNQRTTVDQKAKEMLFRVQQTYAEELKPLLPPEEKTPPTEAGKDKKTKTEPKKNPPSPDFKKLDVESTFPKTVRGYQDIIDQYHGKPIAREAQLELGDLYFNHGQYDKALPLFQKAKSAARNPVEKFGAQYALAMTFENLGNADSAIQEFEELSQSKEESYAQLAKLSLARIWLKKNPQKGKALLNEIEKKDPNTELGRQARTYRLLAE